MLTSSAASGGGGACAAQPAAACRPARIDSRRTRSIARLRAVVIIQPTGLGGGPVVGNTRPGGAAQPNAGPGDQEDFQAAEEACRDLLPAGGIGDPNATMDPELADQLLEFAQCMRDHGVDMPDPQFEGNRVMQKGPQKVDQAKMREADKACASIRDKIKPPEISDEQKAEFKKAALANSKCMRAHGVPNFPDPVFDEDGGAQIRMQRGSGMNPESAKFKAAEKACRDLLPDPETDG